MVDPIDAGNIGVRTNLAAHSLGDSTEA